jgi:hypothetical protein
MARKQQKGLAKTAAALAATALVEKAIQKAAEDPRVRRKAKAVAKSLKKRAKLVSKKLKGVVKKRSAKTTRAARAKRVKRARA